MGSRTTRDTADSLPWAAMFAGLCASMIGIGIARFAYTPLIPPLIEAGWFPAESVVYLGAANLAGYLAGALVARQAGQRFGNVTALKAAMVLTALSFIACGFPLSAAWFFAWRFLSGVTGGVIMILVAAALMPHVPVRVRGFAGGAIFFGLGLGIAGSGTLIPLLLEWGLQTTWIGLGLFSLLLVAASWFAWPQAAPRQQEAVQATAALRAGSALTVLYIQYGLFAAGVVAPMVFLVDYVARGLGQGAHVGAGFWVLYGLGAILGPLGYGRLADWIGNRRTLQSVLVVQVLAISLLLASPHLVTTGIAAVLIGSFPPGAVPLVLHRVHHLLPGNPQAQSAAWSRATVIFAVVQAASGYAYSWLFAESGGNYALLFALGGGSLLLALAGDLIAAALQRRVPVVLHEPQNCSQG